MNTKKTAITLAMMAMMVAMVFAAPASAQVEVQIGLILDGSGSITPGGWGIITEGVASAVEDPDCLPHDGTVELTVIQFGYASGAPAQVEVAPTVITAANAATVAATIRTIPFGNGMTPMAHGIHLTADTMAASSEFNPTIKQVLNLATDGVPNIMGPLGGNNPAHSAELSRDYAITTLGMTEAQDEIDAEAIGGGANINWLKDNIVYKQPGTIATLGDPTSYTPGWVCAVTDAQEFAESMCEKFGAIIDDDEPCCVPVPVGPGPSGVTGVPLLTPFGAVLLIGLLAIVGAVGIRRRT